jgi:hypothetical protein
MKSNDSRFDDFDFRKTCQLIISHFCINLIISRTLNIIAPYQTTVIRITMNLL